MLLQLRNSVYQVWLRKQLCAGRAWCTGQLTPCLVTSEYFQGTVMGIWSPMHNHAEGAWASLLKWILLKLNSVGSQIHSERRIGAFLKCLCWVFSGMSLLSAMFYFKAQGGKKGFRVTVHRWALDKHLSGASDKEDSRPYLNGKEKATSSARWHGMTQWESQKYPSWGMRMLFSRWCCDIHHAANPMIQVSTVKSQWWIETATI